MRAGKQSQTITGIKMTVISGRRYGGADIFRSFNAALDNPNNPNRCTYAQSRADLNSVRIYRACPAENGKHRENIAVSHEGNGEMRGLYG
jgi:hypothetical protein